MKQTTRHPALARLDVLVGEWQIEASVNEQLVGGGRVEFTWTEDGAFLRQYADREDPLSGVRADWVENSPEPVTTIIGLDDASEQFTMLYADDRNVFRVYQMTLEDRVWKLWRNSPEFSQRFTGNVSDDGNTIIGVWEASTDGTIWEIDFHLTYTRLSS